MSTENKNEFSMETIAGRLALLERRLHRVRSLASRTEEILDEVICEMDELQALTGRSKTVKSNLPRSSGPVSGFWKRKQFSGDIPIGALSVDVITHDDGSATVQIDGRKGIPLPPFVAALLIILKTAGTDNHHPAGWKSIAAIQSALKERTRQYHSKSAVKELVYRLRALLEKHGENPFLVQNNRLLGYRFALRQGGNL